MINTSNSNVHNGKLPLWAFVIFAIALFVAILSTSWYYKRESTLTSKTILIIDSTLEQSNLALEQMGLQFNNVMINKLYGKYHREDALYWKPKFDSVSILTGKLLEAIKTKNDSLKEEKLHSPTGGLKTELHNSLKNYYTAILRQIPFEKRKEINQLPIQKLLRQMDETGNQSNVFQTTNPINQSIILSKIKNDVLLSNNIILDFYIQQCSRLILICGGPYPLVTQNTTCLKVGETLEITAGIASYDYYLQTDITINNEKIPLTENENAVYRLKIKDNKIKAIPVTIRFRDPNTGQTKIISQNVSYTVFQPPKN